MALPLTVLEIEEHHAAGTQGTLQTPQDVGQIRRGHMQKTGAGPDAVETLLPYHLFETEHRHVLPQQERCLPGHLRRGIEGLDPEARLTESQRVPSRPATGIKDAPAGAHMRQKTGIQGPQVHIMGCRSVAGRALVIECRIRCHRRPPFISWCRDIAGHGRMALPFPEGAQGLSVAAALPQEVPEQDGRSRTA